VQVPAHRLCRCLHTACAGACTPPVQVPAHRLCRCLHTACEGACTPPVQVPAHRLCRCLHTACAGACSACSPRQVNALNASPAYTYTVSQKKTIHYNIVLNFAKCWPIIKIFSLSDSLVNMQQNRHELSHHTLHVSLNYLVKHPYRKIVKI